METKQVFAIVGNTPKSAEFNLTMEELFDMMQEEKYLDCCTIAVKDEIGEWEIVKWITI